MHRNRKQYRHNKPVRASVLFTGSTAALFFLAVGCRSLPQVEEALPRPASEAPEYEVVLSPGDVLDIRFFYSPELNTVQAIRPDGRIALQLVGEVRAQGMTPRELGAAVTGRYREYLEDLDVTVIVQAFGNRRVYVGGQVITPGPLPMPGPLTVFEALMLAGGVELESGKYNTVLVIRQVEGRWHGGVLDLNRVLRGEQVLPYYLQPLDIVYVPETSITRVNRWIDQHINRILPEVGFTYTINPDGANTFSIGSGFNLD
ncbi:MAG: polysaccharide biosynthesis/export family protein [Spirochaetota bacterium]